MNKLYFEYHSLLKPRYNFAMEPIIILLFPCIAVNALVFILFPVIVEVYRYMWPFCLYRTKGRAWRGCPDIFELSDDIVLINDIHFDTKPGGEL